MYYAIAVHIIRVDEKGWRSSTGLPTFYLHDGVQMITSARDAEKIARRMVQTCIGGDDSTLESISAIATPVEESYGA